MSRYHARPATRSGPAGSTPFSPAQFPPQSPTSTDRSSSMGSKSIDASRSRQGAPYAMTQLPHPPPPAIAPQSSYPSQVHQQSYMYADMRPQTAHVNSAHANSMNMFAGIVGKRRATGGSTAEDAARVLMDREAERQRRIRQAQEAEREARRKKEEEARRQEEEIRRVEEDIKRQKMEAEEKVKKQKEWEKEELRRVAREQREEKEEAELWAAKKKSEAEKRKQREKLDLERSIRSNNSPLDLQNTSITAEQVDTSLISPAMKEKVSFFKRWKIDELPRSPPIEIPQPKTSPAEESKPTIKPGGGGIVPQIDAPVSAVNHGDRIVRVSSQGKTIMLPVKPSTTPLQLIRTSVTFFSFPIDPRNSLLLESFSKSGIQRSLRMYEHIRDVLNSWDADDQHRLILEPYDSSTDNKLFSHSAPKVKPQGGAWTMYFSQKRGKWDKRYITLTPEGQITSAKNESGKDQVNICNLSDFEIFTLSKEGEKKKIKPPKKHCFAIKSMQKSSMFLGETGFMHLFCCSDERLAQDFHNSVFRWRTWYLVHVMGEGSTGPPKIGDNAAAANSAPILSASGGSGANHKRGSSHASQYILGSFKTGLDFDANTFAVNYDDKPKYKHTRLGSDTPLASAINVPSGANGAPSAIEHSKALHARQLSIRRAAIASGGAPLSSAHARTLSSDNHGASGGLQRNVSVRSTTRGRPSLDASRNGASTNTNTTNNLSLSLSNSTGSGSATIPSPLQSPSSPPAFPGIRPLIDLTPQYVAPPQHQRKGRGFKPAAVGPGGLVAAATGPELAPGAIVIPQARDWRRRGDSIGGQAQTQAQVLNRPVTAVAASAAAAGAGTGAGAGGLGRSGSVRSMAGKGAAGGRGLLGDIGGNEGFTGGGLLGERMTGTVGRN